MAAANGKHWRRFRDREAGSALMLLPAAVLIVMLLAAIAIDQARVFVAQRELADLAASAANDAASRGLDIAALRAGQPVRLSPALAQEVVAVTVAANRPSTPADIVAVVVDTDQQTVEVTLHTTVRAFLGRQLLGSRADRSLESTRKARIVLR